MEIPVYLFTGFLESGKTRMISETMADKRFQNKERTLILVCEEGIEEYDTSKYSGKVFTEYVESVGEITREKLSEWLKKYNADRVMVEYNGMWNIGAFYDALPENWFVYQEVMCVDSNTFAVYNANMRTLMYDKLSGCSVVFFNRCNGDTDIMNLHKEVRAVSRTVGIVYEYTDGRIQQDNIEDPLPFDVNAPVIEISDRDYAIWYRDMSEDMKKYQGKTVKFKGIAAKDANLKNGEFAFGRMVMTCCEADTSFHGMIATGETGVEVRNGDWLIVEAVLKKEKHRMYGGYGPVLHVLNIEKTTAPENPVASFV